ncbi:FHA domain-containing protein [Candidatus Woesearchaeota archaeon]|nr:FHA domain-containing protein [Candidatus Woesearchaeota archaeon]
MALSLFKLKGENIPAEKKEDIQINAAAEPGGIQSIIIEKDLITIERSSNADIRVTGERVSRKHCSLIKRDKGWYVKDHNSTAGTYLYRFSENKFIIQLISGEFPLQKGDNIVLGGLMEDRGVVVFSFGG